MITSTSSPTVAVLVLAAFVALGALSACNTIEGAGADIKSGGKAIEEAADDSK
jgi:predicted small secreted protein